MPSSLASCLSIVAPNLFLKKSNAAPLIFVDIFLAPMFYILHIYKGYKNSPISHMFYFFTILNIGLKYNFAKHCVLFYNSY